MIELKSASEIQQMSRASLIAAQCLTFLKNQIRPGVSTETLDRQAEQFVLDRDGECAFKGYRGFPAALCVSVNDEVVHGIPGERILCTGDIVSLDIGVKIDGFYGDCAITVGVDPISKEDLFLIQTTEAALYAGIEQARAGNRLFDISYSIQQHAEQHGFSIVRQFVGHGIGRSLHEEPQVPNFGIPHKGLRLTEGMTLAIEPMVNTGVCEVFVDEDGWTARTADGRKSAHFEHTIAITSGDPLILTSF
ncbi:MAG: type I methionyl aminopeptidase [Candidatus Omnitrophica bacterium]|nr:type I methionyl aminopeptidase [Candidatus Omnitrophota bacterium]